MKIEARWRHRAFTTQRTLTAPYSAKVLVSAERAIDGRLETIHRQCEGDLVGIAHLEGRPCADQTRWRQPPSTTERMSTVPYSAKCSYRLNGRSAADWKPLNTSAKLTRSAASIRRDNPVPTKTRWPQSPSLTERTLTMPCGAKSTYRLNGRFMAVWKSFTARAKLTRSATCIRRDGFVPTRTC